MKSPDTGIPPMPKNWPHGKRAWIEYQQESYNSVADYFKTLQDGQPPKPTRSGIATVYININPTTEMPENPNETIHPAFLETHRHSKRPENPNQPPLPFTFTDG